MCLTGGVGICGEPEFRFNKWYVNTNLMPPDGALIIVQTLNTYPEVREVGVYNKETNWIKTSLSFAFHKQNELPDDAVSKITRFNEWLWMAVVAPIVYPAGVSGCRGSSSGNA